MADGDLDGVVNAGGRTSGEMWYLLNTGSSTAPQFELRVPAANETSREVGVNGVSLVVAHSCLPLITGKLCDS